VNYENLILKTTRDGTNTIFDSTTGEHYHSIYGAHKESQHIFITNGLNYCYKKNIKVFEMGFGTGLNAYLSMIEAKKKDKNIVFHSIELNPLSNDLTQMLNYAEIIEPIFTEYFYKLHECRWNEEIEITKGFRLKKISDSILNISLTDKYDVVFYDAFSPEKQPELWKEKIFEKIINSMNDEGILTTYCVKGTVKRALKAVGFKVEILPGPPGKRHMIRAVK